MDAVEITAARTAAASGVCIRHWAPPGWQRIAIIGCGEQGVYHAVVANALNPSAVIAAYDPDPERSRSLFLTDDLGQFEYYRDHGHFGPWPQVHESVGEGLGRAATAARTVCCNLGVGALDIAFAARVACSADASGDAVRLLR